tara:strand:+ start:122 stop:727 length:606 start_codon:yes stop_codon:yes gene_type:complete
MKKSIARKFKMDGGLEGNEKNGGYPGKTKRSKEIQKGISNKTDKEKKDILMRNLSSYNVGKLDTGGKYRQEMPDQMKNIALRSDSVRAAFHSLIPSAFKMKGFSGFGDGTSPVKKDKDPKNKTLAYDPDPVKNEMRSDTVKTFVHQQHFADQKGKYPVTHKIGEDAEKRLKGHKVTKAEVDRQHNTKTFKDFMEKNPRKGL